MNKIEFSAPQGFDPAYWVLERPKVFYNKNTKKQVMYVHLDDKIYQAAEVGIAISDDPDKDFKNDQALPPIWYGKSEYWPVY